MFTKLINLKARLLITAGKHLTSIDKAMKIIKEYKLDVKTGTAITIRAMLVTAKTNLENWHIPGSVEATGFTLEQMKEVNESTAIDELLSVLEEMGYAKLSDDMFAALNNLPQEELAKVDLSSFEIHQP